MNALLKVLVSQLARPHGALARVIAPLLDRGNLTINLHTIAALDLQPGDRVLEIGFGGGAGLATALAHEPKVALTGIEISPEMLKRAQSRFAGRVNVSLGPVEAIPAGSAAFDKVFGVNVVYFWPDLDRALSEIQRVLAPRGVLVLGVRPKEILQRLDFGSAGHRVWNPEQYVAALQSAGFTDVQARRVPDPNGAYVISAQRA